MPRCQFDTGRTGNGPPTAFYEPNFISEEEEKRLLECVYSAPKPKWQQLSHRRLQNWGGLPHPKGMIAESIPEWLMKYVSLVNNLQLFGDKKANHVLVNEYLPGQGIMPHTDGPLFHPVITTISLGSHTVLNFYERLDSDKVDEKDSQLPSNQQRKRVMSILLEPRSLLVVKDDLYHNHLHSIDETESDEITDLTVNRGNMPIGEVLQRKTRISLTIRHVPKTSKVPIFLMKNK
ncbi:Alpha-ketoglutarate-dependent dioxygenase alkB-like protein 6 [Frankliniella fusca]|uniref:Alpha-ketoglutarate-dependent dioxygenase alkB-like protein 6 n=1 Tax=Frankliniella fusca TaxID=407009 RepID=A0AAE1LMX4_9NEOP|nr:Alpha-ketoglutarate-dependent dioxygenase alkB-like protein 6 [Frankliniella fusca]